MAATGDAGKPDEGRGGRSMWMKVAAAALLMQALTVGLVAALTWVIVQHHKEIVVVGGTLAAQGDAAARPVAVAAATREWRLEHIRHLRIQWLRAMLDVTLAVNATSTVIHRVAHVDVEAAGAPNEPHARVTIHTETGTSVVIGPSDGGVSSSSGALRRRRAGSASPASGADADADGSSACIGRGDVSYHEGASTARLCSHLRVSGASGEALDVLGSLGGSLGSMGASFGTEYPDIRTFPIENSANGGGSEVEDAQRGLSEEEDLAVDVEYLLTSEELAAGCGDRVTCGATYVEIEMLEILEALGYETPRPRPWPGFK